MTALNNSTRRRLQKLRQVPSVWEGDRRTLIPGFVANAESDSELQGDCILWVDGSEGVVRAMDMVPPESGPEVVVRTLLRAMEYPHSSTRPARPQKIVVRDREIQFFLRGVLQDLEINVEYAPELPLIDEIYRGIQEVASNRPPNLPAEYADRLMRMAYNLWNDAPWETLDEEKIFALELNYGDINTLYVCVLGMLGMEYGILMYRSVDSLKRFRQQVLSAKDSSEKLEGAFLNQDCFFLTFDQEEAIEGLSAVEEEFQATGVRPAFGNLHPLEGMRPVLYEDEAAPVLVGITALHRFFQQHLRSLSVESFPEIISRYRITDPKESQKKVSVKVSTLPALSNELFEMSVGLEIDEDEEFGAISAIVPILRDDLVPKDVFYSLGAMSWEILDFLRTNVKVHQSAELDFPTQSDGFPVILLQTSRPKAMALIDGLQAAGGLRAICFNPGEDPFANQQYDLGILQTQNGDLHLFGEFLENDPTHVQARKKWDQRCKKTQGYCGLVIAKGLKGSNRGNPEFKDMLALFEARTISSKELGLGLLELVPQTE
jgi:hypothetical protein